MVRMTAEGAAFWERVFQPNWCAYFSAEEEHQTGSGEVLLRLRSADPVLMAKLLKLYSCSGAFRVAEKRVSVIRNWPATYWKTLDYGYEVITSIGSDISLHSEFSEADSEWYYGLVESWRRDWLWNGRLRLSKRIEERIMADSEHSLRRMD